MIPPPEAAPATNERAEDLPAEVNLTDATTWTRTPFSLGVALPGGEGRWWGPNYDIWAVLNTGLVQYQDGLIQASTRPEPNNDGIRQQFAPGMLAIWAYPNGSKTERAPQGGAFPQASFMSHLRKKGISTLQRSGHTYPPTSPGLAVSYGLRMNEHLQKDHSRVDHGVPIGGLECADPAALNHDGFVRGTSLLEEARYWRREGSDMSARGGTFPPSLR